MIHRRSFLLGLGAAPAAVIPAAKPVADPELVALQKAAWRAMLDAQMFASYPLFVMDPKKCSIVDPSSSV